MADKPRWYHQARASGGWHAPRLVRVWIVAPLAVLGAVGAGWLIYRFVVDPLVADTADALKLTLAILTLAGAVLAGVYAYRKQRIAESDAHRADANQFADRYTTAAEQLGHDRAAVRLAGVYALARLADDWEEQRQVCIDVLCAYLRMPYQPDPEAASTTSEGESPSSTPAAYKEGEQEVRHTIIRVIRDHLQPDAPTSWSAYNFDLRNVTFDGGNLSGSHFRGTVAFDGAEFSGGTVSFVDAEFSGTGSFEKATFNDGSVAFDGVKFSGGTVAFTRAEFSGGTVSFEKAEFSGGTVLFWSAKFTGGKVDFGGAKFTGGTVLFWGAKFSGGRVAFDGVSFDGATVSFDGVSFNGATVSFDGAEFSGDEVSFALAEFSRGTVSFTLTKFNGGTVFFRSAKFNGGIIGFVGTEFSGGTVAFTVAKFTGGRVNFDEVTGAPQDWGPFQPSPGSGG